MNRKDELVVLRMPLVIFAAFLISALVAKVML